jgi:hypothetical protein
MSSGAATLVTTALVLFVPGALLALVLRPRIGIIRLAALAPVLTVISFYALGEIGLITHLPVNPATAGVLTAAFGVAAFVRRNAEEPEPEIGSTPIATALLVLGIVGGVLVWGWALHGHSIIPANFDAANHGFMTTRIADSSSVRPSEVYRTDVYRGTSKAYDFYPVGLHVVAALEHRLTGATVARSLLSLMVLAGGVVLPLGLFVLARRLVPHRPLVAGFTAVLVPMLRMFPYKPSLWGGLSLLLGVALIPIAVDALLDGVERGRWPALVCGGLAVAALFITHSTEVFVALALAGVLVVGMVLEAPSWSRLWSALRRLVLMGVVTAASLAVVVPLLVQGAGERTNFQIATVQSLPDAVGDLATLHVAVDAGQPLLAALVLLGVAVALWRHEQVAWLVAFAGVVGIFLLADTSKSGVAEALAFPWYRQPERISYNVAFFVAFFGGYALDATSTALGRVARGPVLSAAPTALVVAAVGLAIGWPSSRSTVRLAHASYARFEPVRKDDLAAYDWLGDHVRDGDRVLNDLDYDGSLWMYAFDGVAPLFGANSEATVDLADFQERVWLRDHITELGTNPRVAQLVDKWRVRWVYLGEDNFTGSPPVLHLESLRRTPGLTEVFTRGQSHVFRVTPP